jgi:uncharacterized repeat protein (TIGR03803 family)
VLYRFRGGADGVEPSAGLTSVNGGLYGSTVLGGSSNSCCGTVFRLLPGREQTVYRFKGKTDGISPQGPLAYQNGVLYGTTAEGGAKGCLGAGCGTVFSVTTSGKEQVLYRFPGGKGGGIPTGGVIAIRNVLYGTTEYGGQASLCVNECGTVFALSESGSETVLHYFTGGRDGFLPDGALIAIGDSLFGTTQSGGRGWPAGYGCCGTVFSVSKSGIEGVLYPFYATPSDGAEPDSALVDVRGVLYGTTSGGGKTPGSDCASCGTIFAVSQSGKEEILHHFKGGSDGATPGGTLVWDGKRFYGTTLQGGSSDNAVCEGGCGTVFSITTSGKEQVLYRFQGGNDGSLPGTNLLLLNGTLYGVTQRGGGAGCGHGCGTVFALRVGSQSGDVALR